MRRVAALVAAGLVFAGCARNPATGKNELMLVSESQEIQMGQQADSQVIGSIGLYPDQALQSYVMDLGKKLAMEIQMQDAGFLLLIFHSAVGRDSALRVVARARSASHRPAWFNSDHRISVTTVAIAPQAMLTTAEVLNISTSPRAANA